MEAAHRVFGSGGAKLFVKCPPMSVLGYFKGVELYHGRIIKSREPLKQTL